MCKSPCYLLTTARMSRALSSSNSLPSYLTSVPPYLLKITTSPSATSSGTRLPLSSIRPGPVASTLPSCGFSLAVSGMTRPDAVVCFERLNEDTILERLDRDCHVQTPFTCDVGWFAMCSRRDVVAGAVPAELAHST